MNLYREIKNDISVIILIILIIMLVKNQFNFGLDDSLAYVKLGFGCAIFQDDITGYCYLISYKKAKELLNVEKKDIKGLKC